VTCTYQYKAAHSMVRIHSFIHHSLVLHLRPAPLCCSSVSVSVLVSVSSLRTFAMSKPETPQFSNVALYVPLLPIGMDAHPHATNS
jgi:hypothetical protein